ncbi:6-phosphogluconolactonase [Chitinilyticum piscinae]|uniref:6-phosphogluconolactonase n=1 Tax=Chitinilyticum piscinae TaxID=2866724 RepID=A0A8J7FNR7_9NEIS|nr:6-phosphogluconolactonase [Chitinilyticum piscinae]MBE9610800.1 6-phosphogluconolactonase [Chitinilyticum piscinae]
MSLTWHQFAKKEELDQQLAGFIAERLRTAIARDGRASLAVSGGRTPAGMFRALQALEIDWQQVDITLVDERWVPNDHADSNERLTRENLLQGPVAAATFHSMVNDAATPHDGLSGIEARLSNMKTPIDILILGMGDDGHTASLFPQAPELEAACASTALVAAINPVTAPHLRITLTLPAIAAAAAIAVHITGDSKKTLLETALAEDKPLTEQYPIRRVLDRVAGKAHVFWAA